MLHDELRTKVEAATTRLSNCPNVRLILQPAHKRNYGRLFDLWPSWLVIHSTMGSFESAISWFQNPASGVSAHFVVSRDGKIANCVPLNRIAYHAGASQSLKHDIRSFNKVSFGIELETSHLDQGYTTIQYDVINSVGQVLGCEHVAGHEDICYPKGRKLDPGPNFQWQNICFGAKYERN